RRIEIDSMAVASGETPANVGALRESLIADLARRGERVEIVALGGTARVLKAAGDVTGLGTGAGTTTQSGGWPIVSIAFDEARSVGAVVFFTLTIEAREVVFNAVSSGYNVVRDPESREWKKDEGGRAYLKVSGEIELKPGQDAEAYVRTVILDPARTTAQAAGDEFVETRTRRDRDTAFCAYSYERKAPSFGGGGGGTGATVVDEDDVTARTVEGRVTRTISGTVTGANALTTAQGRKLSPTPANHVLEREDIGVPNTQSGSVRYSYVYQTGTAGTGALSGTVFFRYSQSVEQSGGERDVMVGEFDNADPIKGFGVRRIARYVERTDIEFTGTVPSVANLPRATNLDAADQVSARGITRRAAGAGMRAMSLVRVYMRATPYASEPVPVEVP
ncbi:MAG: hypothetical protein ACKVZJ_10170, partial [Phycisphaerales bacterium]